MMILADRLKALKHVLLDMDGTIYLGEKLFDATLPFIELLDELEIGYSFITNNNSRSRAEYTEYLDSIGIIAVGDRVFTSAHASIEYLSSSMPGHKNVFLIGTPGLREDLELGGLTVVQSQEQPDVVLVGFDPSLSYEHLGQAAYWIKQGLPYVATHPDLVCPTNLPTVLPDCGATCALLEAATGRRPDAVPGKPSPEMLQGVMHRRGVTPSESAMIGDRIYTDIRMARDAGVLAVLTLTGEATADQAAQSAWEPDMTVSDLSDFAMRLRASRE